VSLTEEKKDLMDVFMSVTRCTPFPAVPAAVGDGIMS